MSRPADDAGRAFEAVYRDTRRDVLAYLVRRAANAEEAADLLAETYLVAWRQLEAIPASEGARLWLFGVARNVQLKSARRRRVADALVERLAGELRAARVVSPEDQPARDALGAALRALSERDREIVTLTAWEGLTPREIATVLGISANAVRIRLHRTRARLARELAAERGGAAQCAPVAEG